MSKANEIHANYVSVMDYPCEPDITRNDDNLDRIDRTIINSKECIKLKGNFQWIPVIQGYQLSEYQYSIDNMDSILEQYDYVAIGSLCHRKKIRDIREAVRYIKRELPNHKLHAFGMEVRALRIGSVYNSLESSDTQAWRFDLEQSVKKERHFAKTRDEMAECLPRYALKIDALHTGPLDEYIEAEL